MMNHQVSVSAKKNISAISRAQQVFVQRTATQVDKSTTVPPIVHDVLRSPGQSMDANTRELMQSRFGHNFGDVRVHTDERAAESARAVNARAYTVGRDVVFNTGRYAPSTDAGRQLIAHELAHTVQQRGNTSNDMQIGKPGNLFEREANRSADAVMRGNTPGSFTSIDHATVQRQESDDTQHTPPPPRVIVVPPPLTTRFQLSSPWLLSGTSAQTPRGTPLLSPSPSFGGLTGNPPSAHPSLTSLTSSLSPMTFTPSTLSPQAPNYLAPTPPVATPAPSSTLPVNTSVGTDVGYHAGEGHPVAELNVTMTADWSAAQWRLGRTSGWSLNFLDQPSAGIQVSFNPLAGAPSEIASLSHQMAINAMNLVLTRNDDRLLEVAATSGFQVAAGGDSFATVGGQVTYHPNDRMGIFANGAAEIHRDGNQLVPRWGSFTVGLTFDIDQNKSKH